MTDEIPEKRPTGRPTKYKEEYATTVVKHAMLGVTNEELARVVFEVPLKTLERWISRHEDFRGALKRGREEADTGVAASLYRRALGYSHDAEKIFYDPKTAAVTKVKFTQRYAPDTIACIFWLKNRRPDLWRDKQNVELVGKDDGPVSIENVDADKLRDTLNDRIAGIAARMGTDGGTSGAE